MLQHPYLICHRQGKGPSASAFTDHNGKHRHCETCQCIEIFCNGFTLSTFLSFQPAECAWRIYKADHRTVKFLCLLHQTQGFPVPLRRYHSEIPGNVFLCTLSFFLYKDSYRLSVEKCHTTDHCRIIPAVTVSVKFHEIVKKRFDVILSCRACFGSGKLDMFPGSEISGWNEVRPDPIIFLNSFHRFLIVRLEPIFNVRIIGLYII